MHIFPTETIALIERQESIRIAVTARIGEGLALSGESAAIFENSESDVSKNFLNGSKWFLNGWFTNFNFQ